MRKLSYAAQAKGRRLLRVLFLRVGSLPTHPGRRCRLLRHTNNPTTSHGVTAQSRGKPVRAPGAVRIADLASERYAHEEPEHGAAKCLGQPCGFRKF